VRRLVPLLHAALLLVFLPALSHPFLWPKLALLCAGAIAALLLRKEPAPAGTSGISRAVPLMWLVLLSASALQAAAIKAKQPKEAWACGQLSLRGSGGQLSGTASCAAEQKVTASVKCAQP
jgi:hypothetical protein